MKGHNEGYRLGECTIHEDPIHAKCDREFRSPLPLEDYVKSKYGDYEVVEYGVSYRTSTSKFVIKIKPKSSDSSNTSE